MATIIQRVKNILEKPKVEWPIIDKETTNTADLYKKYIVPLASISPVAMIIWFSLAGQFEPTIEPITILVGWYGLTLLVPYGLALLINALAPTFAGQKNFIQAFKVASYAGTGVWLTGMFALIPGLGGLVLMIFLLYSIKLLYLGLPVLMKVPQEKASWYTTVVVVAVIVMSYLLVYAVMPPPK